MEERLPITLATNTSTTSLKMLKTEESDEGLGGNRGIPALAITLDDEEMGV